MPGSWGPPGMLARCAGHWAAGGGSPIAINRDWEGLPNAELCVGDPESDPPWAWRPLAAPARSGQL
jgi:hypothetical protein